MTERIPDIVQVYNAIKTLKAHCDNTICLICPFNEACNSEEWEYRGNPHFSKLIEELKLAAEVEIEYRRSK